MLRYNPRLALYAQTKLIMLYGRLRSKIRPTKSCIDLVSILFLSTVLFMSLDLLGYFFDFDKLRVFVGCYLQREIERYKHALALTTKNRSEKCLNEDNTRIC